MGDTCTIQAFETEQMYVRVCTYSVHKIYTKIENNYKMLNVFSLALNMSISKSRTNQELIYIYAQIDVNLCT